MDLRDKAALMALRDSLVKDVIFSDIEDSLMSFGLISPEEKQKICIDRDQNRQTSTLLDILLEKNDARTFNCLVSSLETPYEFLSKQLSHARERPEIHLTKKAKDYESVFIEGGIPITPLGNIELKYVSELKESLVKLSNRSDGGWILVKGHGGSGKSVIVSQAIRGNDVSGNPVAAYFFNRVFWFTIGNLRAAEWESMLLTRMQNICIRLNPELRSSPPTNLDEAKDMFRKIMLEKYPCGLVVLDDVWEPRILRYFNVQSRIVVTSRKSDIFSRIQTGNPQRCIKISVDEGLTEDATLKLLTELINSDASSGQVSDSFSTEDLRRVQRLHSKCKGNPFIVSIFGGLLRGRLSQFERYLKKFEDNLLKNVELETGDYEFVSIKDAILVSIDDLEENYKEHYLHLCIFSEDSFLSARFLSNYCWEDQEGNPLSEDDALDLMCLFVRRSIATMEKYKPGGELLTLHDLTVGALKTEYEAKRTSFNNQFVERVLHYRNSKTSWTDVDINDETHYLAYNFVYHLVSSDGVSIDQKLRILVDFDFISWLCCRIGPDNLAFVYQYSVKCLKVGESAEKVLTDFVDFFRSPVFRIQATYLATRRSDSAMIQLALTLPEDNSVRNYAIEAAKSHQHFFCFYYWLNFSQTEEQIYNTIKVDNDVLTFALDRHSDHAVVASDLSAVVLDLKTGLRTFRIRQEDMAGSNAQGDAQESSPIVSALFSPDNRSLIILTENALFRYKLPDSAFEIGTRPSPVAPASSEGGSLHFPPGRPRSGTTGNGRQDLVRIEPAYKNQDRDSMFTAMCFESEAKLLVGSHDGKIKVFTLTDSLTNLSSEFDIDNCRIPGTRINHITASQSAYSTTTMVAVSGLNDCVYVYESKYNIKKYTGHAKNSNPFRCAFDPRPEPRFAVSVANNEIHLWHPKTQQMLAREFGPRLTMFTSIAISSEGVYLAVGTSTRAHIYLYRVENLTDSYSLVLVDELNGSGSYTKCLAFATSGKPWLYSMSDMSTEGVLTCWHTNFHTTPFHADENAERSSSIFFGSESATLRLRTVFDAVTVDGEIFVACQSVRKSLLILKSSGSELQVVENGKLSGEKNRIRKAAAIRIAPNGKYAVFTFDDKVTIAKEYNGAWNFECSYVDTRIVEIVFLSNCQGFVGSDGNNKLLLFQDASCVQQVELQHKRLIAIDSCVSTSRVSALVMFDRGWNHSSAVDLGINENFCGSIGDELQGSLLCCSFCPSRGGFVAGGTELGSLILWAVAADNSTSIVEMRHRTEGESNNCILRCLQFSHQIDNDCYLLAGAFDDNMFSLWALRDGRLIDLVNCQPVQIGVPLQPSNVGCIAWTMHTDQTGVRHHKLIIASDCVHVCCLPDQELRGRLYSVPSTPQIKPSMVSLYSRQNVTKVQVLNKGQDLLFVDNSHTVFWMRSLHSEDEAAQSLPPMGPSVPEIPIGESQEI